MRKEDMNIAIGIAGLAAAILLFGGKKAADSGYGGAFPIPFVEGAGTPEAAVVTTLSGSPSTSFQISDKIFAAMQGIIQPATTVYGGSTSQSKKELAIIQAAGFSTEGLKGSFDTGTGTAYTFAPETAAVEKKLISIAGFDTSGVQGSFDPSTGKITTFGGTGQVSYTAPATTKKESSIIASASMAAANVGSGRTGGTWTSAGYTTRY